MPTSENVTTVTGALETGVWKLGLIMLALGVMHLFNIFVLGRFRKRYQAETSTGSSLPRRGRLASCPKPAV